MAAFLTIEADKKKASPESNDAFNNVSASYFLLAASATAFAWAASAASLT